MSLKPYSVLLLYPDYLDSSGHETYYIHVDAIDEFEAVDKARESAVADNDLPMDHRHDFVELLVIAGHHPGIATFNK